MRDLSSSVSLEKAVLLWVGWNNSPPSQRAESMAGWRRGQEGGRVRAVRPVKGVEGVPPRRLQGINKEPSDMTPGLVMVLPLPTPPALASVSSPRRHGAQHRQGREAADPPVLVPASTELIMENEEVIGHTG